MSEDKIIQDANNNQIDLLPTNIIPIGEPATKKVSKTLEAARKLKGSITVNDAALYIH